MKSDVPSILNQCALIACAFVWGLPEFLALQRVRYQAWRATRFPR